MVQLLRMQKRPSFSATKEEICDVQNEPIVQKLFEDAIEVLRLAGAYEKDTGKLSALVWLLGYSEYFFKEVDKILNPSDANFKGSDNKKVGCRKLSFHRGVRIV